jgi:hypothetical protein
MLMSRLFQLALFATLIGALGCQPNAISKQNAPREDTKNVEAAEVPHATDISKTEVMPKVGTFICKGREYPIKSAKISAALADPYWCDKYNRGKGKSLRWFISIESEGGPSVDFDGLPIQVTNWHKLAPFTTEWTETLDPATEDGYASMYISDHQWVAPGRLEIKSRDGVKFLVVASGKNEEGVEFSLAATAVFREIRVRGSEKDTDETILTRLKAQLDDSNLVAAPFVLHLQYSSGVRMGEAIFTPTP